MGITTKPLDAVIAIRRILRAGVALLHARDLNFDGDNFAITIEQQDDGSQMATVSLAGAMSVDAAAFGSQHQVKSRLLRLHTTNATPTAFVDGSATNALQVAAGQAADLVGTIIGKKRSSVDIYRADVRGTLSNNDPLVITLSGDAVTNELKTGALAAASVAITTDGTGGFVVTVTGIAATSIDWSFAVQVQPIGVIA